MRTLREVRIESRKRTAWLLVRQGCVFSLLMTLHYFQYHEVILILAGPFFFYQLREFDYEFDYARENQKDDKC